MKGKFLLPLLALLGALLLGAWLTGRRSPAYPAGQFGPLLVFAVLAVGLAWAAVVVVRRRRN